MNYFIIVYNNLVTNLLPELLRRLKMISWLRILITPTKWLYDVFFTNRINNVYYLNHNSQVCYLEAVLNDAFDNITRGIYIVDTLYAENIALYLRIEYRYAYLYTIAEDNPMHLYTIAEIAAADAADVFIVMVPVAVVYDETRMRALINKYRLPGKAAYGIVTF